MTQRTILSGLMLLALMTPWSETSATESLEMDPALMTQVYADPPATGALITRLFPDGTAIDSGLKPGDLILSYNGMISASRTQFVKMVASTSRDDQINIVVLRGTEHKLLQVPGGKLGVIIAFLRKGIPYTLAKLNPLPDATPGSELDLSLLKSHPHLENWYTLNFNNQPVGALYLDILVHGKYIQWTVEESYTTIHSDYPSGHFIARMITTFDNHPELIRSAQINVLSGNRSLQTLRRFDAGKKCELKVETGTDPNSLPFPLDPHKLVLCRLVTYEMMQFMPLAKGRCLHFQYFNPTTSSIEEGALHVIDVDPSKVDAKDAWSAEAVFQGEGPFLATLDAHGHVLHGIFDTLESGTLTYQSSSEAAANAALDGKLSLICPFDAPDHLPDDDLVQ